MRTRLLLLLFLLSSLTLTMSVSAQSEERQTPPQTTETVDAPILGWYLVPILGAMRRHRHELNDRMYDRPENQLDDNSISYIN